MIEFINVTKEYSDTQALQNVSFHIDDGEFVFIIGHSGAGKTTLTKRLLREEKVTEGKILVDGIDVTELSARGIPYYRRKLGMVFQDFRLFRDKTAYENIACIMRAVGTPGAEIRRRVPALLRTVAMEDKQKHFPRELSGGEQQRVALARAIANNPDIIIADEPTGNIDPEMSIEIMNLLMKINQILGKTVIVVTHEMDLVERFGHRVITLDGGKLDSDINLESAVADFEDSENTGGENE
ncbi:MAG: cell division ATP-binding protein FtsE [Clostridia bacterium]|nr:cell division ATP-binding protein FtsE [Clostridia bacterium]